MYFPMYKTRKSLRDIIKAADVPWMTAQQTAHGQIETLDRTKPLDSLYRIVGTGGIEAAAWRLQRRNTLPVKMNEHQYKVFHDAFPPEFDRHRLSLRRPEPVRKRVSSVERISQIAARATITRSIP